MRFLTQTEPQSTEIRGGRSGSVSLLANGSASPPDYCHHAGNQAIQSLFRSGIVQASLSVGRADDPAEHEAEAIAAQVTSAKTVDIANKAPLSIHRSAAPGPSSARVPGIVAQVLHSPGHPLDSATRAFFEPRFGRDFSDVRIHSGTEAAESAHSIQAQAYTAGSDIVFASGQYSPHTTSGRTLLAHELAHVLQQENGSRNTSGLKEHSGYEQSGSTSKTLSGKQTNPRSGVIQRQTINPGPQTQWQASHINAGLLGPGCYAAADTNGNYSGGPSGSGLSHSDPYQTFCPVICSHSPLPFSPLFHVDGIQAPRPQPFDPPRLAATIKFVPSSGGPESILLQSTGTGAYAGPGHPLTTSFGANLSFFHPPGAGTLVVSLILDDPTSGSIATYAEAIPVVDCPQSGKPGISVPASAVELDLFLHVPDPDGAPLVYQRADKNTPWSGGATVPVFKDDSGYFYTYDGRRIYLPGRP